MVNYIQEIRALLIKTCYYFKRVREHIRDNCDTNIFEQL